MNSVKKNDLWNGNNLSHGKEERTSLGIEIPVVFVETTDGHYWKLSNKFSWLINGDGDAHGPFVTRAYAEDDAKKLLNNVIQKALAPEVY